MGNTAEEKAIVYKKFLSRKHTSDFTDSDERNQIQEIRGKEIFFNRRYRR